MNLGINYESSDEDDAPPAPQPQKTAVNEAPRTAPPPSSKVVLAPTAQPSTSQGPTQASQGQSPRPPQGPPQAPLNGPTLGPSLGPTSPPSTTDGPSDTAPGSPYTFTRSTIRTLTLPPVPNFAIPPSPPGSPPLRATTKFTQFLKLKQQGVHFNQRLESSTVLRDPAHLQRLLDFAGISAEEQYASTLPEGLAVPTVWPEGSYSQDLNASQKRILQEREEANKATPREGIDFVPASASASNSGTGTPAGRAQGGVSVRQPQSSVDRIMAGLDKPAAKRKELEQRGGRSDSSSRITPKRKRDEGERR